jgi:hypothetical protein
MGWIVIVLPLSSIIPLPVGEGRGEGITLSWWERAGVRGSLYHRERGKG